MILPTVQNMARHHIFPYQRVVFCPAGKREKDLRVYCAPVDGGRCESVKWEFSGGAAGTWGGRQALEGGWMNIKFMAAIKRRWRCREFCQPITIEI